MNDDFWNDDDVYEDEDLTRSDKKGKVTASNKKRKWREIELIKEQRRLRRDIAIYDNYSY